MSEKPKNEKPKCPKCGKPWTSYSIIDGVFQPCGHSNLTKKERQENRKILRGINTMARRMKKG